MWYDLFIKVRKVKTYIWYRRLNLIFIVLDFFVQKGFCGVVGLEGGGGGGEGEGGGGGGRGATGLLSETCKRWT